MTLANRVARRFLARSRPTAVYFEEEVDAAVDRIKALRTQAARLAKARDLLRPVAECLRSKALGKIYVELDTTVAQIPALVREMGGILSDLLTIDAELVDEQRRLTRLILEDETDEHYEIDPRDVKVPSAAVKAVAARIKKYEKAVETIFDKAFSLDDIGTAGSLELRDYEKTLEKLDSWEELNFHEVDFDPTSLVEAVMSRASDEAF